LLERVFLLSFVVVAYPRRRRGGGNVEIGNIDFQGLWEGWKKQFHRFFQAFQQTVISTASFPALSWARCFPAPDRDAS
jgi:hypothetical protein